jgi:hypothetical protein
MFRKEIQPKKPLFNLSHQDTLVHIGSCFSEHIGNKFSDLGMQSLVNPFGQQFNPISICQAITRILSGKLYVETDLILHDSLYHSLDHHSDFSGTDSSVVLEHINKQLLRAKVELKKATCLFITPGTAHYFIWKETGKTVSNCHKIPANMFEPKMATSDEIYTIMHETIEQLYKLNPKIQLVLTVSPVRYMAFGVFENTVSKSMIFNAFHQLIQQYPNIYYFPSYDLMMDDLRDYRFYDKDMIHPNEVAIEYIWNKLSATICSKECIELFEKVGDLRRAYRHRPRNFDSKSHQIFLQKIFNDMEALDEQYPYIDFSHEKENIAFGFR